MIEIGVSPIAFEIGSIVVRWYGILVALAVAVLILWMFREVKKVNIPYDRVLTGALIAIPSGIVVSKLIHIIDLWDYYVQNPGLIISGEGLTIWGAVIGATIGVLVYSKYSGFPFGKVGDAIAPGIILVQAIGRVGCTINGCCYGAPTTLPWGIIYTNPQSYGYEASLLLPPGVGLHPTQIYEIIFNLIVFGVLLKLRGRLKPDGSVFVLYYAFYSAWRLGIGFIREGTNFAGGLQEAQVIGIIILAFAIPFLVFKTRWVKKEETEAEAVEEIVKD